MKISIKDPVRLNELILMKGFNKAEFGKVLNLSNPMIIQITNGVRNPSPRIAKKIADVLQCEWTELFEIVRN